MNGVEWMLDISEFLCLLMFSFVVVLSVHGWSMRRTYRGSRGYGVRGNSSPGSSSWHMLGVQSL